jgi:hypothetical protein
MSDSLPTPAQRWAAIKEWEALRRRFPQMPKAALFTESKEPEPGKEQEG